ncbi:MAG: hypothetical protein J5716_06065 [Alphaproteobacteria bacterium]|nr:hypothetical protein [Alphaproteobacteria bacterium]
MASTKNSEPGLYWTPKGGNNHEAMFASCHKYTSVTKDKETGKVSKTTILIDMGQNEDPKDFADGVYQKVVPALTDCLAIPGQPEPEEPAAAIFLTHSHSDHIDAIFEYVQMGVELPPIYGTEYTINALRAEFIKRQIPVPEGLEMKTVEAGDTIEIGNMKVEALAASHSIPGCLSFKLSNEEVSAFHSGDTKSDQTSSLGDGRGVSLDAYRAMEGVDFAVWDGAMANRSGHSTSEAGAKEEYKKIFEDKANEGKQIIVAMPAAHSQRLASVIAAAAEAGKHVIINGGATMEINYVALGDNGYDLQEKYPDITIATAGSDEAQKIKPEDCITITTGIYGEKNSPFVKKLQGLDDSFVLRDDAVIVSPAVGKAVSEREKIEDLLDGYIEEDPDHRSGMKIITAETVKGIGSSGHAQHDDFFQDLLPALKAKVNVPTHVGSAKKAEQFMQEMRDAGYGTLSEYPRNGYTVQVTKQGCQIVAKEEVKWIGAKYSKKKDKDGNDVLDKQLSWSVEDDHGFSTGDFRQDNARKKIKEWQQKNSQGNNQDKGNNQNNVNSSIIKDIKRDGR